MNQTWLLLGCGKKKAARSCRAADLYTGSLTRARIQWAERTGRPWLILSAQHGLLAPETWLAPYDAHLTTLRADKLAIWRANTTAQIAALLAPDQQPETLTLELHAGLEYRNALAPLLRELRFNVTEPTAGLGIISQMNHYHKGAR